MEDGFSLKEAAAIADVSESVVRTAVERGIVNPKPRRVGRAVRYHFSADDIFFTKLVASFPFPLRRADKEALWAMIRHKRAKSGRWERRRADLVVRNDQMALLVEIKPVKAAVERAIGIYRRGRRRIISDPNILSGEPVFSGTRIPISHVAGMLARHVSRAEIEEDYPALSVEDIEFAALYAKIGPAPGRPRKPLATKRRKDWKLSARAAAPD